MLPGFVLLGIAALMLYQGFTGNSAIGEVQKLVSGEPAFTTQGQKLADVVHNPDNIPVTEVQRPGENSPGGSGPAVIDDDQGRNVDRNRSSSEPRLE